jgi:hypothetical protein
VRRMRRPLPTRRGDFLSTISTPEPMVADYPLTCD